MRKLIVRGNDCEEEVFEVLVERLCNTLAAFILKLDRSSEPSYFTGTKVGRFLADCQTLKCVIFAFKHVPSVETCAAFGCSKSLRYVCLNCIDDAGCSRFNLPDQHYDALIEARKRMLNQESKQ